MDIKSRRFIFLIPAFLFFLLLLAALFLFFRRPSPKIYLDLSQSNVATSDGENLYFRSGDQLFSWQVTEKGEPSVVLDDFYGSQIRFVGQKLYYYMEDTGDFCYLDLETGQQNTICRIYDVQHTTASSLCFGQWWMKDGHFYFLAPDEEKDPNLLALSIVVLDKDGTVQQRIHLPEDIKWLHCVYQDALYYQSKADGMHYAFQYETGERSLFADSRLVDIAGVREGKLVLCLKGDNGQKYSYALMDEKGRMADTPELGHGFIQAIDDTCYFSDGLYFTRHSDGAEYPIVSTTSPKTDYLLVDGYLCGELIAHRVIWADGVSVQNLTGKTQAEIDGLLSQQKYGYDIFEGDKLFFVVGPDNTVYLLNAYNFFDAYNGVYA